MTEEEIIQIWNETVGIDLQNLRKFAKAIIQKCKDCEYKKQLEDLKSKLDKRGILY